MMYGLDKLEMLDLNSQLTQPHGGSVAMPYLHDACRTRTVKDILSFAKPKLTLKIPNI